MYVYSINVFLNYVVIEIYYQFNYLIFLTMMRYILKSISYIFMSILCTFVYQSLCVETNTIKDSTRPSTVRNNAFESRRFTN